MTVAPAVTALLNRLLCEIEAGKLEKGDLFFFFLTLSQSKNVIFPLYSISLLISPTCLPFCSWSVRGEAGPELPPHPGQLCTTPLPDHPGPDKLSPPVRNSAQ